jgi:hypothetical protein
MVAAEQRACFKGLGEGLRDHLNEGNPLRAEYEEQSALIAEVFASQPDLAVTQDALAGFLNGFMITGIHFLSEDDVDRRNDEMFPVLGGIYLLSVGAPLSCSPAERDALRTGFYRRVTAPMLDHLLPQTADVEERYSLAEEAIGQVFATVTDVPINGESLAGFILGFLYSQRFVPVDVSGRVEIIVAAYLMADRLDLSASGPAAGRGARGRMPTSGPRV